MLTIKRLKELIAELPDGAGVVAYEGEGIGLRVVHKGKYGWINTGEDDEICEDDSGEHALTEFTQPVSDSSSSKEV
jgi:hypothetical protein